MGASSVPRIGEGMVGMHLQRVESDEVMESKDNQICHESAHDILRAP